MRVLLGITKFHLHKGVPAEGIIRVAGIIRGRALYEEIRYMKAAFNVSEIVSSDLKISKIATNYF